MKRLHKISAYLLIVLGLAYQYFTPLKYASLTLDAIWFASAGVTIIESDLWASSAHGWS